MPRIIPYSAGFGLRVKDCDTNSFFLRGGFRGGFFDIIRGMRHCRADIPNRCCHLTSRVARRAFEGVQAANRRKLWSVPSRWLGGSVVRWLGSCANPQPETHTSRPENEGLVPQSAHFEMSHYSWRAGECYADYLRSRGVCPQVFKRVFIY